MFAGKKSAQIREILISESAWEEMTCLFAPSLSHTPEINNAEFYDNVVLETFLTASPDSLGATILFLAMLIYWQKR
nr:hypothetical protein [uncultured Halomonas sp.]